MDPAPWWELFDVELEEDIWSVCCTLLDLYKRWCGDTRWLVAGTEGFNMGKRRDVWRRAAELDLPVTKDEMRKALGQA